MMMKLKSLKESEKEHHSTVLNKTRRDLEKASRLLKIPLQEGKPGINQYTISRPDPQGS